LTCKVLCCRRSCCSDAEKRALTPHVSDDDGGNVGPVGVQRYRRLPHLLQRAGSTGRHGPVAHRRRRPVHGRSRARPRAALRLRRPSPRQVGRRRATQQLLRYRLHQPTQSGSVSVAQPDAKNSDERGTESGVPGG